MEHKIFGAMEFDKTFEFDDAFTQKLNVIEEKIHELQNLIEYLNKLN